MRSFRLLSVFFLLLVQGCAVIRHSAKYDFGEGVYYGSILRGRSSRVFVAEDKDKDTITVMPMVRNDVFDTSRKVILPVSAKKFQAKQYYYKPSLDIDVLTIPFKYRPSVEGFPRQFNANYNGALYIGYRTDGYRATYRSNHLGAYTRHLTHIGFSVGVFGGIGATAMNSWVTKDKIDIEYDGFIISKGVAAIFAVNNLSAGISLGYDHLTDENRQYWIYQGRSYIGFMLGLNLN